MAVLPVHWKSRPSIRQSSHCGGVRQRSSILAHAGFFKELQKALNPQQQQNVSQQQQQQQQQQQDISQQAVQDAQQAVVSQATAGTPAKPEYPPYQILKQGGSYGLRLYDVYPVVEMDYSRREEAYLALGEYQGGSNVTNTRFGFTQPVIMCYHPDGRKVMQMMVGTPKGSKPVQQQQQQQQEEEGTQQQQHGSNSSSSITSLPAPTDPDVRLAVAGGELVAVLFFEGYITPEAAAAARQKLTQALTADGISLAPEEAAGFFRVGQYGQVHTLETRVNELLLRVSV